MHPGRLYIDRIVAPEAHDGLAAAVAGKLAERLDKHFGEGVLTHAEAGIDAAQIEASPAADRPKLLAAAAKASRVLIGELVAIDGGLWINLAFYDARQRRIVDRISERTGLTPESVLAALERELGGLLAIPVGEKTPSGELVKSLINSKLGLIKHCYHRAIEREPELGGQLVLQLAIDRAGRFETPKIDPERTTLDDAQVHQCAIDALDGIETGFDFEQRTTATFPFHFKPQ
jgi:hypothetical protein